MGIDALYRVSTDLLKMSSHFGKTLFSKKTFKISNVLSFLGVGQKRGFERKMDFITY